jgi:hypothetical protein
MFDFLLDIWDLDEQIFWEESGFPLRFDHTKTESRIDEFKNEHDARQYIRKYATDYRVPYDPWVTRGIIPDSIDEGDEIILQRDYVIPPGTFSENFDLADYVYLVYRRIETDNDEVLAE